MEIIVLLISVSVTIAIGFLVIFLWNMRSGQYDDTYTPSVRMLFDDEKKTTQQIKNRKADKNHSGD